MGTDGRTALVTGAGRSVGRGIALALAADGAAVAVNDLHAERAESVAQEITSAGGRAASVPFDVTDQTEVLAGVDNITHTLGPVDILVNNAGIPETANAGRTQFRDTTPDMWKPYIDINLYGSMYCIHATLGGMADRGWGRIIQISSGTASRGLNASVGLYAASKAGIEGLLRHLTHEVAEQGITVNALALGLMENVGDRLASGDPTSKMILDRVPLQRLGTPAEIGAAVVWLSSELGAFVTGQTIHLNGGSFHGR
jgi:NAD(P)-dependent dehydrogenase (short-subunit alcohol dehydrogenase family)